MIYFAELVGSSIVKVGFTGSAVERRLRALKREWGLVGSLHLLGTIPGGLPVERKLHRILSSYQVRGEWYFLEPRVRDFIDTCIEKGDVEMARAVHSGSIRDPLDACDNRLHEWDSYQQRGLC